MKFAFTAKKVTALAAMSALLVVGKWALSGLANIEVVTLFCALFGYTFGFIAVIPATIFCIEETLAWGTGFYSWIPSYFIHWNVIVIAFAVLRKFRHTPKKKADYILPVVLGVGLTATFGVLTSLVNSIFAVIYTDISKFFYYFAIDYTRGILFYAIQIACNVVLFTVAFAPLSKILDGVKGRIFPDNSPSPKVEGAAPDDAPPPSTTQNR